MGTANTMQLMGEIFNLVLPGTSCIPAVDSLKIRKAREAGIHMVEMVKQNMRPSQLITRETLLNAIIFDMAIAGSTNALLHILAMGYELGIDISMEDFEKYAKEIRCIVGVIPSGPYTINDLYHAGGALAVMKMLESKLFLDVPTMTGTTWGELLKHVHAKSSDLLRSLDNPLYDLPGLQILLRQFGTQWRQSFVLLACLKKCVYSAAKQNASIMTPKLTMQLLQEKSYPAMLL